MTDPNYIISDEEANMLADADSPKGACLAARVMIEEGQCEVARITDADGDWILDMHQNETGGMQTHFFDTAKTRKFRAAAKK